MTQRSTTPGLGRAVARFLELLPLIGWGDGEKASTADGAQADVAVPVGGGRPV